MTEFNPERILRVLTHIQTFTASLAFHRATITNLNTPKSEEEYAAWVRTNFLDYAIARFACFFGSTGSNPTHWKNLVEEEHQVDFRAELLSKTSQSLEEWQNYRNLLLNFRDRYLAHLDDENQFVLPSLNQAHIAAKHYFDWLIERNSGLLINHPEFERDLQQYYEAKLQLGESKYNCLL